VLVGEVLDLLAPDGRGIFLDGTLGGGGHTEAILARCPECTVLAVDRDGEALREALERLAPWGARFRAVQSGFDRAVEAHGLSKGSLDGVLLDLGVSSHQLDDDPRGFAFRRGVPLDMRMGVQEDAPTAAELLNEGEEAELGRIFREYGEEPRGRRLAREVIRRRATRSFEVSDDLVNALAGTLGRAPLAREKARVFQALRIAVNRELEALEEALPRFRDALRPGGRLVVIAYHSLEDRIVKHTFREWSRRCICPPELPRCQCTGVAAGETLTTRPVYPTDEETARNPRARSARLRAWRKAE